MCVRSAWTSRGCGPGSGRRLAAYDDAGPRRDFLLTATPGAGKTTFALAVAAGCCAAGSIDRVVVVCPTDHLRTQWADAAARSGWCSTRR